MKLRFVLVRVAILASIFAPSLAICEAVEQVAPHSAITPVPRGKFGTHHHNRINQRVKQGNVDLVFIGDSITRKWYRKKAWSDYYGKRNAVNMGINGDRTQHVLWRLEHGNVDGISPKLAVVMIGTNNSRHNTPEEIAEGITLIVQTLRAKLPQTKILLLGIFPRGPDPNDPNRKVIEKTNHLIAPLGTDPMVLYTDIGSKFLESNGTVSRDVMPDLLHLSPTAYYTWAKAIEPIVAESLGPLPETESGKKEESVIRVGVFNGPGYNAAAWRATLFESILRMDPDVHVTSMGADRMREDGLDTLDVVCFPGGSTARISGILERSGRDKVKKFVKKGGGYVGICAGGYLVALDEGKYERIQMANVKQVEPYKYADRGTAVVELKLAEAGKNLLPECEGMPSIFMQYANGMTCVPGKDPNLASYESLITFVSDVHHAVPAAAAGAMPGKTAVLRTTYGKGTLVLCSPHPEVTPGFEWMLPRMVRWAARKKAIAYPARFVKPNRYTKEIMFDGPWGKQQQANLKLLSKGNAEEKIKALKALKEMGSRHHTLKKSLRTFLSDESPKVLKVAIELLIHYNQFLALEDVKEALAREKDPAVKDLLKKAVAHLSIEPACCH